MGLISTPEVSWSEPWFFLMRIREAAGWRRRILLALALSAIMFAAIYNLGPVQRGLLSSIGLGLTCGFALVALMDVANMQRDVSVYKDSVVVGTNIGRARFTTFEFDSIEAVDLRRADEWNYPFGCMIMDLGDEEGFMVAVPSKVSLDTLANILYRLDVAVSLMGWNPPVGDSRVQVKDSVELAPETARGNVTIVDIEETEPRLMTGGHIAVQVVIAIGPLAVSFITGIVAAILVYQRRADMSAVQIGLVLAAAAAFFVLSFIYLINAGQFLSAAFGVGAARKRLPMRLEAMFSGLEDDLFTVGIFDREKWTAVVEKELDYGFLQVNSVEQQLKFEGNKQRWTLPFSALTSCRIEESIVGSEANQNAERRYYVVITANDEKDDNWEVGMKFVRTEIGRDNPETRHSQARLLFDKLSSVL